MSRDYITGEEDLVGPDGGMVPSAIVSLYRQGPGGGVEKGLYVEAQALASATAFRQGALSVAVGRAPGQDLTASWDGNPDCALKVMGRNYAANASGGAVQGVGIQARNSGTNLTWVKAVDINARNDSGKTVASLYGVFIRVEDYGTISTDAVALDIQMSIEGACPTGGKTAINIRNTDGSAMNAVGQVFAISHTSTNGFTYLFNFGAATGDTFAVGTLTQSGGGDVLCDAKIAVVANGTPYWIPLYN